MHVCMCVCVCMRVCVVLSVNQKGLHGVLNTALGQLASTVGLLSTASCVMSVCVLCDACLCVYVLFSTACRQKELIIKSAFSQECFAR